jgi:hypothetical protein
MLRDAWEQRVQEASDDRHALRRRLAELEEQSEKLVDLVWKANPLLQPAYEERLAKLLQERALVAERIEKSAGHPQ